jgi:hypothetical protein
MGFMIIFSHIFMAFVGFIIGFLASSKVDTTDKKYEFEKDENTVKLEKEFENFLNYDGSVQE